MLTRTFTLGRYTCVERLGTGPAGELWRAKRFGLVGVERQLLLVKLHPSLKKDAAAMTRLQAALKSYAALDDQQGLLGLYDQGSQGPEAFVVYDFPGFADLRKLRSGLELAVGSGRVAALWPGLIAVIGQSLSSTLANLHEHGLWHGYLSPASIWIDAGGVFSSGNRQGRVLIAELGLGQLLPPSGWASDSNLKPLHSYLPKELLSGGSAGLTSDIFALGAILGELLGSTTGESDAASVALLVGLRSLIDRARAIAASDRPQSMRELATAFAALPVAQSELLRETLAATAQQFQFAGDTVPQPVKISERSSAEPLPPPPGSKSADSKLAVNVNLSGAVAAARFRPSAPGDKSAAAGSAGDSKPPARAVAAAAGPVKPSPSSGQRGEAEDTPLPVSRPLLVTYPKIQAEPPAAAAKSAPAATDSKARPPTGDHQRLRGTSKDNLKIAQKNARSGIDWLTSKSGQVAVKGEPDPAAAARPAVASQPPGSLKGAAVPSSSKPPGRRASPVSVNPRGARSAAADDVSAVTPTAEVDVHTASTELARAEVGAAHKRAERSANIRGAAAAMSASLDPLSVGETNPQLAAVAPPVSRLGDEPTNPVSLDAVARASQQLLDEAAEPRPKRISEPSPHVLSNTAPSEIIEVPPGPDPLESTGPDHSLDSQPPAMLDPPPPSKLPWRLVAVAGLAALLVIGGLSYVLRGWSSSPTGPGDAGAATASDAGAGADRPDRVAGDSLVLSSTPPAAILLDGEAQGKTPATLKVKAGKHKLVLVAAGHTLLKREITGGSQLDITLEQAKLAADTSGPVELRIKCKSEGKLRILVDGQDSGQSCPSDDLSLSPGKHVLGFFDPAADALVKEKKLKLKAGKKPTKVKLKI